MTAPAKPFAHPARTILILSLAMAIGLGIGRFAYALVLPDMRDSLGWSYSTAGFMNTLNAIGYLGGALVASPIVRRIGFYRSVVIGAVVCIASLAVSVSDNPLVFALVRLVSGASTALIVVGGGILAAAVAHTRPGHSAFLISLFYTGPGTGIIISGVMSPLLLQEIGPGSWWIVWLALAAATALLLIPLLLNPIRVPHTAAKTGPAPSIPVKPIAAYLAGYFFFGAGYVGYMTFLIAYVRVNGGDAIAQSLVWCMIGISGCMAPWIWRRITVRGTGGGGMTALLSVVTTGGTMIALLGTSTPILALSAFVFGSAFFSVSAATTSFAQMNYELPAQPKAIGFMTIAISVGQALGPFITGAITDVMGSLSYALYLSSAMLAAGAVFCALQRPVKG